MGIIMTDQRERAVGDALDACQCAVTEYYLAMDDEDETRIAEAEKWILRAAKAEAMLALLTDLYKFGYTLTTDHDRVRKLLIEILGSDPSE